MRHNIFRTKKLGSDHGFTAVELLVTLFIAAIFISTGYQLYSLVVNDKGESGIRSIVSSAARDYLQDYKRYVTNPCTAQTIDNAVSITIGDVSNASITSEISCPYTNAKSISKVVVTINYNDPQQTVGAATYYSGDSAD